MDGSSTAKGNKLNPMSVLNINAGSVAPLYDAQSKGTNNTVPSNIDFGLSLTMPEQDNIIVDNPK